MAERILFVDDEPNVLAGIRRTLRRRFDIETAGSGAEGLEILAREGFAVIVSDMRMPQMDGAAFLERAREIRPHSVRLMLTGTGDQRTASEAINRGAIFRFLAKPCPADELSAALSAAIDQHRLLVAEKELLEGTLRSAVKVLVEVLALSKPTAFGRASRIKRLVEGMARELDVEVGWELEVAAMLSQLGCITIPDETLENVYRGAKLRPKEAVMFRGHPRVGAELVGSIPRLDRVAAIIRAQEHRFRGGPPPQGEDIPIESRILKAALDFDTLVAAGDEAGPAIGELREREGVYDPRVVDALLAFVGQVADERVVDVEIHQLRSGYIIHADISDERGTVLVAAGQEVTASLATRLANYAHTSTVSSPIKVRILEGEWSSALPAEERRAS